MRGFWGEGGLGKAPGMDDVPFRGPAGFLIRRPDDFVVRATNDFCVTGSDGFLVGDTNAFLVRGTDDFLVRPRATAPHFRTLQNNDEA